MSPTARPVAWPESVDLDDTAPYAFSVVFSSTMEAPGRRGLHTHPTGVIGMRLSGGRYGVELDSGFVAIPSRCAVWVPPGCRHNVVQMADTTSVSLHIAPEVASRMPAEPMRCFVNPMTFEMMKHFAVVYGTTEKGIHAKRLARILIEEVLAAPRIPRGFAPVPRDERLMRIFHSLDVPDFRRLTADRIAETVGVSARTLSRLTLQETGLSFGQWVLHTVMLYALEDLARGETVEATAGLAGFETASAFIRAFARIFGVTPGEYMKRQQPVEPRVTLAAGGE